MEAGDPREKLALALDFAMEVATRRKNTKAIKLCQELNIQLEGVDEQPGADATLQGIKRELRWLITDLLAAIKFEMREIVIPFIEVKGPTHEFGTLMFPDYFQWLSNKENCVAGDLVKILEEDTEKLRVSTELLDKDPHF